MPPIHIIAPFLNANGGDWRAIDMYLELRKNNEVYLWSQNQVHKSMRQYPIRLVEPYKAIYPREGTLYVCGTATAIGHWYEASTFSRIVLIHNLYDQDIFYRAMHRLSLNGSRQIDIAYASELVKSSIGLPGEILYPLPHHERFTPLPRKSSKDVQFTLGRISSDDIRKHHFLDIPLYKELSNNGIHIKIIGGTCLAPWLGKDKNIELLTTIPNHEVPEMLSTFDCFFYRVSSHWKEAFGIVVAEAILSGLPVVCYNEGGYTEFIKGKKNGFLFETNAEAIDIVFSLKSKIDLCHKSNHLEY
ncbi:MAG: glycosyltransferase [Methylophilaceae bacterium]|nr:glycosyltransferase [Methylophilaceae bacterium]